MAHKGTKLHSGPILMEHGHSETHVIVGFNHPVTRLVLTLDEAHAMIKCLSDSARMLTDYLASHAKQVN